MAEQLRRFHCRQSKSKEQLYRIVTMKIVVLLSAVVEAPVEDAADNRNLLFATMNTNERLTDTVQNHGSSEARKAAGAATPL